MGTQLPPTFRPMYIVAKRSPISATEELLSVLCVTVPYGRLRAYLTRHFCSMINRPICNRIVLCDSYNSVHRTAQNSCKIMLPLFVRTLVAVAQMFHAKRITSLPPAAMYTVACCVEYQSARSIYSLPRRPRS